MSNNVGNEDVQGNRNWRQDMVANGISSVEQTNGPLTAVKKPYYLQLIWDEYKRRQRENPGYRAKDLAAFLHCDPGHMSRIISGRSALTPKMAVRIIDSLKLDENDTQRFIDSAAETYTRHLVKQIHTKLREYRKAALDA